MNDTYWREPSGRITKVEKLTQRQARLLELKGWSRYVSEDEFKARMASEEGSK
jgi:hypothetical protein